MPDASRPARDAPNATDAPDAAADADRAFAGLLQRLHDRHGVPADGLAAAGVRAWLRGLAAPRLGRAWTDRHLGPGPADAGGLDAADPAAIAGIYARLRDLAARVDDGRVVLAERPFARRRAGAYYTPDALVRLVLAEAGVGPATAAVLDPACGPGAFLLAALDRLAPRPADRPAAARRLAGIDLDPLAVACARVAVALAATPAGAAPPELADRIVCADALLADDALWAGLAPPGGWPAIVGNPPWERAKLQQVEWLAEHDPGFRAGDAAARQAYLDALDAADGPLGCAYRADAAARRALARRLRQRYPETCGGDANLYAGFAALSARRLAPDGRAALLVPSGIAADRHTSGFVRAMADAGRLAAFLDFENRGPCTKGGARRPFFPGVDGRFKFACLTLTGRAGGVARSRLAVSARTVAEAAGGPRPLALSGRALRTLNPGTGGLPLLASRGDAALALRLHRRGRPLVDRSAPVPVGQYPVAYRRMFDMTNDAGRFVPAAVAGPEHLPLYEGKMVQAYDHRAAGVDVRAGNLKRPGQPRRTTPSERADPAFRPAARFAVAADDVPWPAGLDWAVALKHVTSPTNRRSVIAAVVPRCAAGNSLPLMLPAETGAAGLVAYRRLAPLLLANLNALVLDWLARGKLQGQNLNLYILEQLPVIPPARIDAATAEAIRADVLALSYTAHDLGGFARDLGHGGPPFAWDDRRRRAAAARLDARFAQLYGLDAAGLERVLTGFPQLERQERAATGRFATADAVRAAFADVQAAIPTGTQLYV